MQDSSDKILRTHILIRLHTRQAQRRDPLDRLSRMSHDLSAFREPVLDIVDVSEHVADALDGKLGEVLRGLEQLSVCFIQFLVFQLSLDLGFCSDEGHTVD